jgi:hypothetical protein
MSIPIFAHLAAASFLLPLIYGLRHWATVNSTMKLFVVFSVYAALHVLTELLLGLQHINNQILSDIFQLIEFECIVFLYVKSVKIRIFKDILQIIGMLYCVYWFIEMSFIEIPEEFHVTIAVAANIFLIIASVLIFYEISLITNYQFFNHSIAWIAMGVILYTSGTVLILTMSNTVLKNGIQYFNILWHINWGFCIVGNIFYARSFLCKTL